MITVVPAKRLLQLAAVAGIPLLTGAWIAPALALPALGIFAALAACAFVDARAGRRSILPLKVAPQQRVNLFMGRQDEIELRISNPELRPRGLRIGLNLPPEIVSDQDDLTVSLPGEVEASLIQWPCRPSVRGGFQLASAHIEAESPWGFWNIRKRESPTCEIRVYPDLPAERNKMAAVFLRKQSAGSRAQRLVGKGRDFEKLREYAPGDAFEDIHWKATAKRGRLVTKVFQIERTQQVYIAIDCSRLSNRPASPGATALDRLVSAGLLLCLAAEQQGDQFGLITFSDQVHTMIRARNGKGHFSLCRDALFSLQPRLVTPDFEEFFSCVRSRLRKRALLIVLTALDDPLLAESFSKSVELVNRQHLVMAGMIEPGKVEPVFKTPAETDEAVYESLAGHLLWQKLREIEKRLSMRGVRFTVAPDESLTPELVSRYMAVKQRQML